MEEKIFPLIIKEYILLILSHNDIKTAEKMIDTITKTPYHQLAYSICFNDDLLSIVDDLAVENVIRETLNELNERNSNVLCLYFGIGYNEPMKKVEIAKKLNVSSQRIDEILNKALDKFRLNKIKFEDLVVAEYSKILGKKVHYKFSDDKIYRELIVEGEKLEDSPEPQYTLNYPIEGLGFSKRVYRRLKVSGIDTIQDMICLTEKDLKGMRDIGKHSMLEILEKIVEVRKYLSEEDLNAASKTRYNKSIK